MFWGARNTVSLVWHPIFFFIGVQLLEIFTLREIALFSVRYAKVLEQFEFEDLKGSWEDINASEPIGIKESKKIPFNILPHAPTHRKINPTRTTSNKKCLTRKNPSAQMVWSPSLFSLAFSCLVLLLVSFFT